VYVKLALTLMHLLAATSGHGPMEAEHTVPEQNDASDAASFIACLTPLKHAAVIVGVPLDNHVSELTMV
jgi:hypothetical protein